MTAVVCEVPDPVAEVTKVMVIVLENHGFTQAEKSMPYLKSLAKQYGLATKYTATTHPSLPNYLAIAAGSTMKVTNDGPPSEHKLKGSTVFGGAIDANRTAKCYCDGMVGNAQLKNGGANYAVKHNPWVYFVDEKEDWSLFDVSYDGRTKTKTVTNFSYDAANGNFPNVSLVLPNLKNDAHDGSLGTADAWVKARMSIITKGPDWISGKLAVVVVFDEDNRKEGNRVYTVVAHPSLKNKVVSSALNHYSLSGLLSDVGHSPRLNSAKTAPSMAAAFGLKIG